MDMIENANKLFDIKAFKQNRQLTDLKMNLIISTSLYSHFKQFALTFYISDIIYVNVRRFMQTTPN